MAITNKKTDSIIRKDKDDVKHFNRQNIVLIESNVINKDETFILVSVLFVRNYDIFQKYHNNLQIKYKHIYIYIYIYILNCTPIKYCTQSRKTKFKKKS